MSTNITWNGTSYSIPASGETGWAALSNFLIALGNNAAITEEMKQAIRVATTSPVTVSDTTDCVIAVNRSVAGATTVNLPAGTDGRWFVICDQKADAATNNITVTPNGAETINGSATYVMNQNNEAIIVAYSVTNTRWNVVARFTSGAPLTNPMATTGDMIYGGASGVATKLATGATAGLLHGGNGAVPTWSQVVNADISASAAIDGSKLVAATGAVAGALTATTQTIGGAKTFSAAATFSNDINVAHLINVGFFTDSSTGTVNQLSLNNGSAVNLSAATTITLNGINSGGSVTNGSLCIVLNNTGNNMTVNNNSGSAAAGDKIFLSAASKTVATGGSIWFIYAASGWRGIVSG